MSLTADQLYALLPAVYRTRDQQAGAPLQAFMTVLAEQLELVEDNLQQLYADEFIETCASWVIPYIGDLIGVNGIYQVSSAAYGSRAEVANTIGYRRRKGTLLALEQVAMDVSGMPAHGVEEFKRLITTESMRLVRPHHYTTVDLRHEVIGSDLVGTGGAGLGGRLAGGEDRHPLGAPGARGQRQRAADDLVRLAGINPEADGELDGLVELGAGQALDQVDGFGQAVHRFAVSLGQALLVLLAVLGHRLSSSCPNRRP